MKAILILVLATILSLTLPGSKVCSQTIAIGHVTAEVIESVSAASNAITSFELEMMAENSTRQLKQNDLNSETINLGAITIYSGKDMSCNVVIKPASLSNAEGNNFTLDPSVRNNPFGSGTKADGSQTIQLNGKTNRSLNQASGLYQGSYTVVFAYN